MSDLFAARTQMALSLGFHIVFAEIGIAMPLLMVLAEWRWRRTGDEVYLHLAKRWAKGSAILFAVGAVSGTVLSFELGLLWPRFMQFAGPIIGMPFSLEGFAFFTEAIFLGVYLYGWERISARAHLAAGCIVAASGAASAVFVVMVNAWMNTPRGITILDGRVVGIDPIAGMFNPSTFQQALHMLLAAYAATGLAVAGIHAAVLLKKHDTPFHRRAMTIALMIGAPAALLQPLSGDVSARAVAAWQPVKLAALEAQFVTQTRSAAANRRHSGSRCQEDEVRDRDSARPFVSRVSRLERRGPWPRRRAAGTVAADSSGALQLSDHGWAGDCHGTREPCRDRDGN